MFRLGAHSAILMFLAGLFLLRESRLPPLSDLDEAFADFLSRNSHRGDEVPARMTFVEITDETLKEHPWPWSPLDLALFFQSGNNFNAELLATDEMLSGPGLESLRELTRATARWAGAEPTRAGTSISAAS